MINMVLGKHSSVAGDTVGQKFVEIEGVSEKLFIEHNDELSHIE